jgi:hypothetical protein
MSGTRRRYQIVTAATVIVAWTGFYLAVVTISPPPHSETSRAAVNRELALILAVPTLVYVVAALLLLHHWLSGAGARLSTMDSPGRLLAVAVSTLPIHRRDWGNAMTAELAEIRGRSARWRFALSCARAALWPPRAGGWPVLALVTGVVVAAIQAAGPAVDTAVPGMRVFAVSFVGLVGAMVILAVARSRRPRLPVPAATVLVTGGVTAANAATVIFLLRQPTAAKSLSPAGAVFLTVVLAGCLWVAVASPPSLGTSRLAPHLGVAAAIAFVVGLLLLIRIVYDPHLDPAARQELGGLMIQWLLFGPAATFFFPAFAAGSLSRSFRSGLQAGVWTAIASLPLAYALWISEALRVYATHGGLLLDGDAGPVGANLGDALFWVLGVIVVVGLPCTVIGAAVGAYKPAPRVAQPEAGGTTTGR